MMKTYKQIAVLSLSVSLFCAFGATSELFGAEKPNILFIAVDDMNDWNGVLKGNSQSKTPHMETLASKGMVFSNAHCAAPISLFCKSLSCLCVPFFALHASLAQS